MKRKPRYLFITGRLAEPALRQTVAAIGERLGFDWEIAVAPISVVALATTQWLARHVAIPSGVDRVILPGLCRGSVSSFAVHNTTVVEKGPKDLRDLPDYFATPSAAAADYGSYDIEILYEINDAPRKSLADILADADRARAAGADVIDLGCMPDHTWSGVGEAVRALREQGHRVSVDSFNRREVELAAAAGAELVLSVNSGNREYAPDWGCEVVVIPDVPKTLERFDETIAYLADRGVAMRLDPILEPIAFGFAASLGRYVDCRRRYPQFEMLMGVGNVTELTDADSAAINVVLAGFCQELGIRSVLTTQVANWCQTCVKELDLARRLVAYACRRRVLPKHLEPDLLLLRDAKVASFPDEFYRTLAANIKDRNVRIFAERDHLHVINRDGHFVGDDPFALFASLLRASPVTPEHAFYLGYEMAKATTALTLGKRYSQDEPLRWGFLSRPESSRGFQETDEEEGGSGNADATAD